MEDEIFSAEIPMPKGKRGKIAPPQVKQKRKYTRKMNDKPTTLAKELEKVKVDPSSSDPAETKAKPSSPEQEPEAPQIPFDYLLAASTEYFGRQAVKNYCNIRAFVELAGLVHPDDWPKLADTLKNIQP